MNLEGEKERKRTEQSFFVPLEDIQKNGYDLSINKYKEAIYTPTKYPPKEEILSDIEALQQELSGELAKLRGML